MFGVLNNIYPSKILNCSNRISCSSVMTVTVGITCTACLHHFLHLQRAPGAADFVLWSSTRSKVKFDFRIVPWFVAPQDMGHIALIGNIVLKSGMACVCGIDTVVIHFSSGIVNSIVKLFSLNAFTAYSDVARQVEDRGSTNNYSQKVKNYVFISCMFHHSLLC